MYFQPSCEGWTLIGQGQWSDVQQGAVFKTECFTKNDMKCGRHDTAEIGPCSVGCGAVRNHVYSNVNCEEEAVQRYCADTCSSHIQEAFDVSMPVFSRRVA